MDILIESIMRHGFTTVCIADRKTGVLTAGHTRHAALLALGCDRIPMVWQDGTKEDGIAYMVMDNESGRMARMDEAQELRLLRNLQETDQGLFGTGFDEDKYTQLALKVARDQEVDLSEHFRPPKETPLELFQVVITFDNPTRRDEVMEDLNQVYENVRAVNL